MLTGGMILSNSYRFSSITLKGMERRIDAVFEPEGHNGTVYIIEFQAQWNLVAWYNLITKIGLYGEQHVERKIHGILIFSRRTIETQKYHDLLNSIPALMTILYLEDFLPQLLNKEPDNPFVVVFAPLIFEDENLLKHQAPHLWQTIHTALLPDTIRANLKQILEFWFFERFRTLTYQEVLAMLQILTPLEETHAYKEIFAKGELTGEIRGEIKGEIKGKIEGAATLLKLQIARRFGKLPSWAKKRIDTANAIQLEQWAEKIFDAKNVKQLLNSTNNS